MVTGPQIRWLLVSCKKGVKMWNLNVEESIRDFLVWLETPREILSLQKTMNKLELFVFKEVADGVLWLVWETILQRGD